MCNRYTRRFSAIAGVRGRKSLLVFPQLTIEVIVISPFNAVMAKYPW
jgi:hypothetical protein